MTSAAQRAVDRLDGSRAGLNTMRGTAFWSVKAASEELRNIVKRRTADCSIPANAPSLRQFTPPVLPGAFRAANFQGSRVARSPRDVARSA